MDIVSYIACTIAAATLGYLVSEHLLRRKEVDVLRKAAEANQTMAQRVLDLTDIVNGHEMALKTRSGGPQVRPGTFPGTMMG